MGCAREMARRYSEGETALLKITPLGRGFTLRE